LTKHAVEQVAEIGTTEVLAEFAAAGSPATVDHSAEVARALIDTVAVTLGGAETPGERILRSWSRAESPSGPATLWTSGEKTAASTAALVNGTVAHLLDFDDISPSMPLHPSAVLMPALVAVGEARGTDPADFTMAYDVGAAAFRALADVLPQHVHYARGWHSTSTIGRLAAVAALTRLLGLNVRTARHALGIASSLASGSRPNFGSMTKPLHAGAAARDAVMAVELAEAGFTANPAELEAPNGFLERYGDPAEAPIGSPAQTLDERLEYWTDAWVQDWGLKRYASCYGTHRGIDAMLTIRQARVQDGPIDCPVNVRATLHRRGTRPLRRTTPTTGTEAKFSLEYTLAVAYLRGCVTLEDFTEQAFADTQVRALMNAVTVEESEVPPVGPEDYSTGFTVVEATFVDGTTQAARVEVTHGQSTDPLTDDELREKVVDCVLAGGYRAALADQIIEAVTGAPGPAFTSVIPRRNA
jgi:2-methylcitrate dehydratase PrpD